MRVCERSDESVSPDSKHVLRMRRFRARAKKAKGVAMEAQNLAKAVNVRDKMRAAERDALIRKIIMKVNLYTSIKNEMRF